MGNIYTDFKKEKLIPVLFNNISRAFPDMDFKKRGDKWGSPYKLNGERRSRWDKTYIRSIAPSRIAENGEIGSLDVVEFYKERNSLTFFEALEQLSSICGIQPPQKGDIESYKRYQEKQERLEKVASQMEAALYTDEGAETLKYLKEVRLYSDEFIKWGGFGFVAPSLLPELRDLFRWVDSRGEEKNLPFGVGDFYTIAIPYRTGGDIKGFFFRTIKPEEEHYYTTKEGETRKRAKNKNAFISATASQMFNLFGLTGLQLTGSRERDRDIVIVEGQLDALRASFAGVENVVAANGGIIYKEALQEAKRRGVKRAVILFDTEETEEGQAITDKKIEKAIATLKDEGLTPFVATLPSDGGKEDADSFLRNHSPEELKYIVYEAISGDMWLYYRVKTKFADEQPETGYNPDARQIADFSSKTLELCNSPYVSEIDRGKIISDFAATTGIDLQTAADKLKEAELKSKQKAETLSLLTEAIKLAQSGEDVFSMLREKLPDVEGMSTEAEYLKDLALPTREEIRKRRRERPTGAKTPYYFKGKYHTYPLILPSGGLTLICGQTSHGKSRMLENLALQIAQNGEEGAVFYFSYEEDSLAVEIQLLNIFANIEITSYGNNLQTLDEYYGEGKTTYFKEDKLPLFLKKEEEFDKLLLSGKLRILAKYNDGAKLAGAIRSYTRHTKVKAVFVDYVQLMRYKDSKTFGRKDELREICELLKDVAKETGLPIVLAAQLNRQAASPIDMSCQNLADAADIEHAANVVMLLWNSAVKPKAKEQTYYTDRTKETLSPEAVKLQQRDFTAGQGGKLYAILDKNRGGERYIDAVLKFDQNTGYIEPNHSEPQPKPEPQPKQGVIEVDRNVSNNEEEEFPF